MIPESISAGFVLAEHIHSVNPQAKDVGSSRRRDCSFRLPRKRGTAFYGHPKKPRPPRAGLASVRRIAEAHGGDVTHWYDGKEQVFHIVVLLQDT